MNNKRNLILFLIFSLLGIIALFYYSKSVKNEDILITKISSKIFDFNEFEIKTDAKLEINDFKVVNQNSGKTIFKNGKFSKGIKNEYGYCIFELYWKNKKTYVFGHFKTNNWHTNKYVLRIDYPNNELKLNLHIDGPDKNETNFYNKKIE